MTTCSGAGPFSRATRWTASTIIGGRAGTSRRLRCPGIGPGYDPAMADNGYTVTRSTMIGATAEQIYPLVVDFHRWTAWSPWEDLDPALNRTYSGPDAGVGAAYRWSGNRKAGRGSMTVVEADEPSAVLVDLVFEKPFPSRSQSRFTLRPDGGATEVTWTMTGTKTLMSRVMGLVVSMDRLIGPDFERGLAKLKATVEST